MNNQQTELAALLRELNFRTSPENIPPAALAALRAFLEKEKEARAVYRLARLLARSGMSKPQLRSFEQYDWSFNPKTPREDILAFRASNWIDNAANLTLIGDVGLGKSHIAKALCYDALQHGHTVYFTTAFDLLSKIKRAASCASKIDYYGKVIKVLCIDELGYTVYQKDDSDVLFQIISKRSELLSTIVTTNMIPKQWGSIFSGPAASAILDRLSFNGTFLAWEGKSYRPTRGRKK